MMATSIGETVMRAIAMVLFAAGLLTLADAHATTTVGDIANVAPMKQALTGVIRLAGSFHNSPAKLNDKYLAGKSGGWYGIGGPESKIFKKKKIVPCCNNGKH